MDNPFSGLSHLSLQDALLNRLSQLSQLKKESKYLRRKLSECRSDLQQAQFELSQIQQCLNLEKVLPFKAKDSTIDVTVEPLVVPEKDIKTA